MERPCCVATSRPLTVLLTLPPTCILHCSTISQDDAPSIRRTQATFLLCYRRGMIRTYRRTDRSDFQKLSWCEQAPNWDPSRKRVQRADFAVRNDRQVGSRPAPAGTLPLRRFSASDQYGRPDASRVPVERLFTPYAQPATGSSLQHNLTTLRDVVHLLLTNQPEASVP